MEEIVEGWRGKATEREVQEKTLKKKKCRERYRTGC